MKRRDFFKKLGIGVAAVVVTPIVIVNAIDDEQSSQFRKRYGLNREMVMSGNTKFTHVVITDGGQLFMEGKWNRKLTPKEISSLYNCGSPLRYKDIVDNELMPDESISFWTSDFKKLISV
jgi:hypothetical protein